MTAFILTMLPLLLPGLTVLFVRHGYARLTALEKAPIVLAASCAYWIIGFWFLSLVPLPHTAFITGSLAVTGAMALIAVLRQPVLPAIRTTALIPVVTYAALLLPLLHATSGTIAPPGADMSMHAYIAKAIYIRNGFPTTLYPVAPEARFGQYPAGFSVMTATLMHVNGLPVHTNALIVSVLVFWLFGAVLYVLLRSRFDPGVSAVTALIVTWAGKTPLDFFTWGGAPTVWSFAFLMLALAGLLHRKHRWTLLFIVIPAYAAALTHYVPIVVSGYVALATLPFILPRLRSIASPHQHLRDVLLAAGLSVPFAVQLVRMPIKLSYAARSFIAGLQRDELFEWTGSYAWQPVLSTYRFVVNSYGTPLMVLFFLSVLYLARSNRRMAFMSAAILGAIGVLLASSQHWFLPGSEALYPKRVVLFVAPLVAFALASAIVGMKELFGRHLQKRAVSTNALWTLTLIVPVLVLLPRMNEELRFTREAAQQSAVGADDLSAFRWLDGHTKQDDVILNNYQDAGLWIPAIANRRITLYHTNPFDLERMALTRGKETYAFIGARSLTRAPDADPVNENSLKTIPGVTAIEVFRQGKAVVYRLERR